MSSSGVLDIEREGAGGAAADAPSERVLLSRLRRGDPDAFEVLVREHQDRVYDFCVRMLGDREEAHDLVQEIFVSIHQNLGKFREDAKLSTWIFRISKNQCINRLKYLKRRGRGRSDEYGEVGEDVLSGAIGAPPTPDAALESSRERARVQWAISQLEPDARMLVALRDIEGLSYEEIIEITELPEGTVKSRLHRAREKLADLLGQLEE
ncbi:RNA polymerase sigma factor [Hyalangium rubrum]|uniref:Sigma-70 family RNA polymerase sigma factor n=1 Tax=Hyalangium rubrum TaxID=3103134 RepID=A0ABU5HAW0_9BACT|nr:sigma-70 family RNA polymerase sigma factor [Hyalangium sp. s54d21]MDY7229963.1 sigma-70 family RNA polymerase sigma factor [Hyalangium sp. s54d21]